jgi:cytochrome c-type biogenesis protein
VPTDVLDDPGQLLAAYPLAAFGAVFAAGVVSSASPCALATVPLVVGYVGGQTTGDRRRAFGYSLAFVFGLAVTFTALGMAAALLGTLFGRVGGVWFVVLGTLAVLMGLQFMGVLRLRVPQLTGWQPPRVTGWLGALLFVYALGHCALMLAAGTFTGLVQAFAQSRGLTAFSQRLRQALGLVLVGAGGFLIWQA